MDRGVRGVSTLAKSGVAFFMLAVGFALAGGVTLVSAYSSSRSGGNPSGVRTVNITVYWDSRCTNATNTIAWGMIEPNSTLTKTIYLKNSGNSQGALNMTCNGWNPSGSGSYLNLTWNKEGVSLAPNAVVPAVLTLKVSKGVSNFTNFSFDIVIAGVA